MLELLPGLDWGSIGDLGWAFGWKALVTAAVIIAVTRVAEQAGPVLAAILMGMPVSIGPAFVLLAITQERAFVSEGALYAVAGLGSIFAFLVGYARAADRLGLWGSLAVAYLVWVSCNAAIRYLEPGLPAAVGVALGGYALALCSIPRRRLAPRPAQRTPASFVLARGLLAGMVVASVVTGAGLLGPGLSGLLAGFPVVFGCAAWMLTRVGGHRLSVSTLSIAHHGMGSFFGFCLTVHLLCGPFPAGVAIGVGLTLSTVISLAMVYFGPGFRPSPAEASGTGP